MAENKDTLPGWQVGKSLTDTNQYMLDNNIGCDVNFQVHSADGSTVQIPAHKYMLVSRSPVFEAMLCGPGEYKETSGHVGITDVEPEVLREMIKFMYTDEVSITAHNVLYLMTAGRKYILDSLVIKCTDFLETNMSKENVCTIFNHSVLQSDTHLTDKCLSFIAPGIDAILKMESFLDISQPALNKLLEYDELDIANEVCVFEACMQWAQTKCHSANPEHVRNVLGDSLFQIRFASMNSKEFAAVVGVSDILAYREFKVLTLCCAPKNQIKSAFDDAQSKGFNMKTREKKKLSRGIINRFGSTLQDDSMYKAGSDTIYLTVDKPIQLKGITVFGGLRNNDHISCMIRIDHDGKHPTSHTSYLISDGTPKPLEIMFKSRLILQENIRYTIHVLLNGPPTYSGTHGRATVTEQNVTFTFSDCNNRLLNSTTVTQGQIPGFIFIRVDNL